MNRDMDRLKNVLIAIGAIVVVALIVLLALGIRIAGTVFVWILGALVVMFVVGWIVYLAGRSSGRRSSSGSSRQ